MALKPCLVCGRATQGSRCAAHTLRNGSTRSWRKLRGQILRLDAYRCRMCGQPATEVDHILALADSGTDHPSNLRSLCRAHHAERHLYAPKFLGFA